MPDKVKFTVTGDKEIINKLKALGPKVARDVVKPAAKRAAKKFQEAIRAHAPVRSGKLRKSIKVLTSKGPRGFKGKTVVSFATIAGQARPTKKQARQIAGGLIDKVSLSRGKNKIPYYTFMQERGFHVGVKIRKGPNIGSYKAHSGHLGGGGVKFIPGKFFVKHALKSNEAQIRDTLISEILQGIESAAGGP